MPTILLPIHAPVTENVRRAQPAPTSMLLRDWIVRDMNFKLVFASRDDAFDRIARASAEGRVCALNSSTRRVVIDEEHDDAI